MLSSAAFEREIAVSGSLATFLQARSNVLPAVLNDDFISFLKKGMLGIKSGVSISKSIAILRRVSSSMFLIVLSKSNSPSVFRWIPKF